jgi:hypothetical protein
MRRAELRAARANRVFRTDKKRIRTENTVLIKDKDGMGFIRDRRLRADVLFIRAQSTIRADGFSSAQHRKLGTTAMWFLVSTFFNFHHEALKCHTKTSWLRRAAASA